MVQDCKNGPGLSGGNALEVLHPLKTLFVDTRVSYCLTAAFLLAFRPAFSLWMSVGKKKGRVRVCVLVHAKL